jgi:hypothetical protein
LILKKALALVAAVAAMAAAAAVCVVAAAFALYALLRSYIGPAGAAAVIAAMAAVAAAILALITTLQLKARRSRADDQALSARLIDLAREKPIIAAGAVAAAGLLLARSPGVAGAVVSAMMANRARERRARR